jgi:acetoin:2,6-dichlorophenolindophenol oxidoreductase subunit alpha
MVMLQLSRDELVKAYRSMATIRAFEDAVHVACRDAEIPGYVHLCAGQEAAAVGVCIHLKETDFVFGTHRSHGHCIAKGCDPFAMMKEIYGKADGLCKGKGGSMHLASWEKGMAGTNGINAGGLPLACGAALAAKTLRSGAIAVAFAGDGAANQGTTFECLNLASIWRLPVIFVFENNGYALSTAAGSTVAGGDIAKRAEGFGMPGQIADGVDFFAVYDAFLDLAERARGGQGPGLLELKLHRFYGHYEGDAQTYRAQREVDDLRANKDCLRLFRRRVTETSLLDNDQLDAVDSEIKTMIGRVLEQARAAPFPMPDDLLRDVYASY